MPRPVGLGPILDAFPEQISRILAAETPESDLNADELTMALHPATTLSSSTAVSTLGDIDDAVAQSQLLWNYLNNAGTATLFCSDDYIVQWASPSVESMLGYRAANLTGVPILQLADQAHHAEVMTALDRRSSGAGLCVEIHAAHGDLLWCDIDVAEIPGSATPTVVVVLRDASRRVAGSRALKASEERFRSIVNEAPFGIALQDLDGSFVFLNARFKQILGTTANFLLHTELAEHVHGADLEHVYGPRANNEDGATFEIRFLRPDGETRWCSARKIDQRDHSGTLTNYLWVAEDVTARVRAEQDKARLHGLMEASSDLVLVLTPDSIPLYLNPAARKFLGIDPNDELDETATPIQLTTSPPEVTESIRLHMDSGEIWHGELNLYSAESSWEPFSAMIVPDTDANGKLARMSAVLRDISERKRFEERLEWEATHDPLTGLPNRSLLTQRLSAAMERAAREGTRVAVAFLDLDNFRGINESLGHKVGDDLLTQTAGRLSGLIWSHDTVARFGADEFAVLMENLESEEEALALTERIRNALSGRVGMTEVELLMTVTAGLATTDGRRGDPASVIRDAGAALNEAKLRGRNRTELFTGTLRARAVDRLTVETGLRRALRRNELRLYYQPQVNLATGHISGAEALIRWQHPEHGVLGPNEFVPIAEMSGLIIPIGQWVLEESVRQVSDWAADLPHGSDLTMGINLSGKQLVQASLIDEITELLERTAIDPSKLELEITESILLDDVDRSISVLDKLKGLGLKLALDDFGTGYSSLTYLRSFPIDVVKIDRSFVDGISQDGSGAAIVRSVIELATTLGLECIAEGVETVEDMATLRELGCTTAQGFLIAQPLTAADAARLISYDPVW